MSLVTRSCLVLSLVAAGCASEESYPVAASSPSATLQPYPAAAAPLPAPYEVGVATWYGDRLAGHRTASGEPFDPGAMTAAHRTLPLGTWVEVRRPDTGRAVIVRINDRGPWGDASRVIDLSRAAADVLGFTRQGVARVELRLVRWPP